MNGLKAHQSILALGLCLSILFCSTAWARFRPTPTAPRGKIPPMGTRGCATTELDFTALAPVSTIAQLTLDHPTLAWFVPDRDAYPMTLKLFQDVAPQEAMPKWKLIREFPLNSREGVMTFQIPPELLQEGQVYAWQAILMCVPGYPSSNLVTEAQFQVVPTPADLEQKLSQKDAKTRSQLYATAGFWYSAFAEANASKSERLKLIQNLVEYEQTQESNNPRWRERGHQHSKRLDKIVQTLAKP